MTLWSWLLKFLTALILTVTTTTTTSVPPTTTTGKDDAFWRRLANCEQRNGPNFFQFMGGTAEKIGYHPGASYEEQRDMAIEWARRIHPREGTSAGWPTCWWVALKG